MPMPNVMTVLPNICDILCLTPLSLVHSQYYSVVQ